MNVTEQSTAPADALEPQVGAPLHPHAGGDQAGEPVHLPQRLLACGRLDPSRATAAALRGNELSSALRICRAKLAPHGVRIEVLARRASGALVYVYRPTLLTRCIQEERVAAFLRAEGYDPASLSACIEKLHRRICGTDLQSQMTGRCSFPHEIGFSSVTPTKTSSASSRTRARTTCAADAIRISIYARERDAQSCFCCYKNCTAEYERFVRRGRPHRVPCRGRRGLPRHRGVPRRRLSADTCRAECASKSCPRPPRRAASRAPRTPARHRACPKP